MGYIVTNPRSTSEAKVGDTVTTKKFAVRQPPGYKEVSPFVLRGRPPSNRYYPQLKEALEKLSLVMQPYSLPRK